MIHLFRAAGYAAAAITLAAGAAFAAPSSAEEIKPVAITSPLLAHASASLDVGTPEPFDAADTAVSPALPSADLTAPAAVHAAAPAVAAPADKPAQQSLSALVDAHSSLSPDDAEQECLAGAIYFESKGEPLEGQLAVAEVIINRSKSGRFPTSLCGVVKQRSQFSFVRGGRIPPIPANAAWRKALAIAHIAQQDLADSAGSKALFFHANYVRPGWRGLTRVASVGNHIFYR
jgi:spore germination cell wall hydrolase CwlJ-like protein